MKSDHQTDYKLLPLGDSALLIQLDDAIHPDILAKVTAIGQYLEQRPFRGFIEYVPAFSSVAVFFDPLQISFDLLQTQLYDELKIIGAQQVNEETLIRIPVVYGGQFGPDLESLSEQLELSTDEIINIHTAPDYLVYMIGFAPGFPYLGGMNTRIAAPRKEKPRSKIPAGSVGIGGKQTGIYPIETPGGWQIIGRTPLALFDIHAEKPSLLTSGNRIRFEAITEEQYENRRALHGN